MYVCMYVPYRGEGENRNKTGGPDRARDSSDNSLYSVVDSATNKPNPGKATPGRARESCKRVEFALRRVWAPGTNEDAGDGNLRRVVGDW